jgi:hypothetical protein
MMSASPVHGGSSPYSVLGAVPRLLQQQRAQSAGERLEQDEASIASDDRPAKIAL